MAAEGGGHSGVSSGIGCSLSSSAPRAAAHARTTESRFLVAVMAAGSAWTACHSLTTATGSGPRDSTWMPRASAQARTSAGTVLGVTGITLTSAVRVADLDAPIR